MAALVAVAEELDRRAASGSEIRVVFLEHADAEQLLPVLQQLLGQAPTMPTPQQPRAPRSRRGNADTETTPSPATPTIRPVNPRPPAARGRSARATRW